MGFIFEEVVEILRFREKYIMGYGQNVIIGV